MEYSDDDKSKATVTLTYFCLAVLLFFVGVFGGIILATKTNPFNSPIVVTPPHQETSPITDRSPVIVIQTAPFSPRIERSLRDAEYQLEQQTAIGQQILRTQIYDRAVEQNARQQLEMNQIIEEWPSHRH